MTFDGTAAPGDKAGAGFLKADSPNGINTFFDDRVCLFLRNRVVFHNKFDKSPTACIPVHEPRSILSLTVLSHKIPADENGDASQKNKNPALVSANAGFRLTCPVYFPLLFA
ncbi:hypothetical protein [Paenibacillus hamazuiensis]|uniref:hypothetical protein n=1 Tax=Paenibacillus hamazuiensis TaxID=2936508 RepID=UPI00200EDEA7|nr:hypothetical protein [Paenibacillus hamazuiensis]